EREDWIAAADPPSEELVWLLGPEALDWVEERAGSRWDPESRALATTGFFVLRGRDTTRGDHALIRCGPHGALSGGHAHADALAIDLSLAGRPLLIDPGTASYTDPELRGWFRSSAAHNTVTLGGASSSEPSGPFGWSTKASSRLRAWRALRLVDFFEGEHDGFRRLGAGLSHERSVLYVRSGYWVVRDRIGVGAGEREPRAHFNFAPGLSVEPDDRTLRVLDADGAPFATITALGASTWEPCPGRAAPAYGRVLPAEAWAARSDRPSEVVSGIDGVAEIVTLISREGLPLEPIAESAGAAWRIGERGDLLVLTSRGRRTLTTDPGIETDFEWVWARRGSGRGWSAAFAHAGRRLRLAGGAPLELSETAGSIYVEGSGDASAPDLHVESPSPEVGTVVAAWFRDL
ncbi:MAG: heparinase II/III-family protein, partial [Gemmatimonadetes bacterium]|nr:heparinase II/III-family protein [Gemmatimonadota bacterium]